MGLGPSLFGSKKSESETNQIANQNESEPSAALVLGIDLGTTHTLLAKASSKAPEGSALTANQELCIEIEPIVQTTSAGLVKALGHLPSFVYLPNDQLDASQLTLPWNEAPAVLTGAYARELAAKTPGRAIHSAKSWLSHQTKDPRSAHLPQNALEDVTLMSPFEVSKTYLAHLQANWDHQHPEQPLAQQDIVLTVPASFDPAARELTAEAAQSLGFERVTLLEEPQAATYAWIADHPNWREQLNVGDLILVVDVGGGTTDLSLIKVFENDGDLGLERVAVGDHILLGGDNMDLALAYQISQQLTQEGKQLKPWQILGMTHSCREAKEALFADPALESAAVVVPGRGSKLIGGTIKTELSRDLLETSLIEGFFPEVPFDAKPQKNPRAGLQQMGLNYAQDAGITRHIAAFLAQQPDGFAQPNAILLNGGVFKASVLSQRLLAIVNSWLTALKGPATRLLDGCDLDSAVARGAAYYGQVRQGKGLRIRGGLANGFYIGVESSMPAIPGMPAPLQALCIAPFGMEEGETLESVSGQVFGLVVGESVSFQFFGSNVRQDPAGTILDDWEESELTSLPDIQALVPENLVPTLGLRQGAVLPVTLGSRISELGTLELLAYPTAGGEPFKVQMDVRDRLV